MKDKIAFVDFSSTFFDRHAVYCLSSYLKARGIETEYIRGRDFSRTIRHIKKINPRLVLYSAYSCEMETYARFDKLLKQESKAMSVIGGAGPTFETGFLKNRTIDALCVGEGEEALSEFILNGFAPRKNVINNGGILPEEYFPFVDIERLPFPDRSLVYERDSLLKNMPNKQFISGRGCPYFCTYCHNNIQNKMFKDCGPVIRKKSVSYLIDEIKQVKERYPLKVVVFQDDTFILNKDWLFDFMGRFPREVGLPYTCNIRANLIDEQLVRALKESGCACVYWSIESGNSDIRNNLLKRAMSEEQILKTGELLNKYKISHRNGGIIGLPGESLQQMRQTLELNIKTRPGFGFASIFIPYQGLELTDYAIRNGYLASGAMDGLPKNTHLCSVLNFTKKEKAFIKKFTHVYPLFVSYPRFYFNKMLYKALFYLPSPLLYLFFNIFCGYKLSRLYKVKTPLAVKLAILGRYFKNPF